MMAAVKSRCTRVAHALMHLHSPVPHTSIANFYLTQNLLLLHLLTSHPPPTSRLSSSRNACCLTLQPPSVYHRLAGLCQRHHIPRFSMGGKRGVLPPPLFAPRHR